MAESGAQRTGVLVIRAWMAPGEEPGRLIARITGRLDLDCDDESSEIALGAEEVARLAAAWLAAFERGGADEQKRAG